MANPLEPQALCLARTPSRDKEYDSTICSLHTMASLSKNLIIYACKLHEDQAIDNGEEIQRCFRYNDSLFIKCDVSTGELQAQLFAYNKADRNIFRVPQIHYFFRNENKWTVVMDFVDGQHFGEYVAGNSKKRAEAMKSVEAATRH